MFLRPATLSCRLLIFIVSMCDKSTRRLDNAHSGYSAGTETTHYRRDMALKERKVTTFLNIRNMEEYGVSSFRSYTTYLDLRLFRDFHMR